jgi:hypothetical protein
MYILGGDTGMILGHSEMNDMNLPFTKVKWLGLEDDHSPQSTANVNNTWKYISTSPCIFMVWCLIKQRMSSWHGT